MPFENKVRSITVLLTRKNCLKVFESTYWTTKRHIKNIAAEISYYYYYLHFQKSSRNLLKMWLGVKMGYRLLCTYLT